MSPSNRTKRAAARERAERLRRQHERRERLRSLVIWGGTGVIVVALAAVAAVAILDEQTETADLAADVQDYEVSQGHVNTPVDYEQSPPAGGKHDPVWLNCGTYEEPVPDENAVHSMEHGAVWVTYRSDLPADQVDELAQQTPSTYAILSPYDDLEAPVVASAWGKQLALDGANDDRLAEFIETYRQGPQTPEVGAACTGGIGASSEAGSGS